MKTRHISDYKINLKDYKILKELNRGGFGIVYKIRNKNTNVVLAAKVILSGNSEKMQKMIDREINIMIRVAHPTIIKFFGFSLEDFSENQNVTIIMDFAKRGSLSDILKLISRGLTPEEYDNTTRQIILIGVAYGMKHIHDQHAIHRDLKPENILIDEYFHPHISDFGLSKFCKVGHSKEQTTFGGTFEYMAPEIIRNQPYDGKVDVYSFGIIMYQVIGNCSAYPLLENKKMPIYQFQQKVAEENYRPHFDVDFNATQALKELIEKCWSAKPEDRPTFEEIFNNLAYNQKYSVYGLYTTEDKEDADEDEWGDKYYLKDIDFNKIVAYTNEITKTKQDTNIILLNSKLETNEKQIKEQSSKFSEQSRKISELTKKIEEQNKLISKQHDKIHNLKDAMKKMIKQKTKRDQHIKELEGQIDQQNKLIQNVTENNNQIIQEQNKQFQELQDLSQKLITQNKEQSKRIEKLEEEIKMQNKKQKIEKEVEKEKIEKEKELDSKIPK